MKLNAERLERDSRLEQIKNQKINVNIYFYIYN